MQAGNKQCTSRRKAGSMYHYRLNIFLCINMERENNRYRGHKKGVAGKAAAPKVERGNSG